MDYNPARQADRRALAQAILRVVLDAGFMEEAVDSARERVFYREVDQSPGVRVQVWTSIVGHGADAEVRVLGKDAIRVCAVYRSPRARDRGIVSDTRIHRTGTLDAICERLLNRMRRVYGKARRPRRCHKCNAPMFRSKRGNDVCADICFKADVRR